VTAERDDTRVMCFPVWDGRGGRGRIIRQAAACGHRDV